MTENIRTAANQAHSLCSLIDVLTAATQSPENAPDTVSLNEILFLAKGQADELRNLLVDLSGAP